MAADRPVSFQSRFGLNATNFFLADVLGVVMPFLAKFLAERHWRDDAIGLAIAAAGLGVFVMQTPAGFLVDRVRQRRALVVISSLVLGLCYGLLPLLPAKWWTLDPLLFVSGLSGAFFALSWVRLPWAWSDMQPSTGRWVPTRLGTMRGISRRPSRPW